MLYEDVDALCAVGGSVVVRFVHLQESPLSPFVVSRIAGSDFAVPVVAEADFVELLTVTVYVVDGSHLGVLTGLYCILFGGQAIGVVSHRMQDVESLQTLVSAIDVRGNVTERMTHMESGAGRIREHVEDIELRLGRVDFSFIRFVLFPIFLPTGLYFFKIIFHRGL